MVNVHATVDGSGPHVNTKSSESMSFSTVTQMKLRPLQAVTSLDVRQIAPLLINVYGTVRRILDIVYVMQVRLVCNAIVLLRRLSRTMQRMDRVCVHLDGQGSIVVSLHAPLRRHGTVLVLMIIHANLY